MGGSKPCEVPGCKVPAKVGQLTCLPHWRGLPQRLQRDVNDAWRKYRRASGPNQKIVALGDYRKARDAAIKHITDKQDLTAQGDFF